MTEPDPVLADPARERLLDPTERPLAEFSRSTQILVHTAALLGLILAVGVIWYVLVETR
jgi:hypothetical protein